MPSNLTSSHTKKLICEDYINNIPIKEITKKYNLCRGTIRNYINEANVTHRKFKPLKICLICITKAIQINRLQIN
jgi:transposase